MSKALDDIATERRRQILEKGWRAGHDDLHRRAELATAASCYALNAAASPLRLVPHNWPWDTRWWKPTNTRRDLVKAGALIVAEIERLDRAAKTTDTTT